MKSLFEILDGICDEIQYDLNNMTLYDNFTLNNIEDIQSYAEVCDRLISTDEAEKIKKVGHEWLKNIENGGEWSLYRGQAIKALEME